MLLLLFVSYFFYFVACVDNDTLIVGGSTANYRVPYQISLRYKGRHNCGGSILTSRWILSAAHCVVGYNYSLMDVVTGSNLLDTGGDFYKVDDYIYHENYIGTTFKNDISVIKTTTDIVFYDAVAPIQKPTHTIAEGEYLHLSGWGKPSFPGTIPNALQVLIVQVRSLSRCPWKGIDNTQICTFNRYGEGACQGDSGGPLTQGYVQYGVVSYGKPCAIGVPDVHTNLFAYINWLEDKIARY